jgi:hypothetical protein
MRSKNRDFQVDLYEHSLLDIEDLLHPAQAFDHPQDVVKDPDLTLNEKRAVLASWASDACAVEAAPALRCARDGRPTVSTDAILEALRELDRIVEVERTPRFLVRRERTEDQSSGHTTH